MTDSFAILLEELGQVFQMPLHPDKLGACSILIPPNPMILIQPDETQEFLYLFSKIGEIPPGKFRENVLREALKANGEADPRPGVLGYIRGQNMLALHEKVPIHLMNGERLASLIGSFLEMAESWKDSLEQGKPGPGSSPPPLLGPMLGFRP